MVDAPLPQGNAHHLGKGALTGFGDVRQHQPGGIQLVAGAHAGNDGDPGGSGFFDQSQLGGHRVDGIRNEVKALQIHFTAGVVAGVHRYLRLRVDVQDPLACHLHLLHAQGGVERHQLSVQVGDAHRIVIHQGQVPHAAACQSLHHIGAYAPDAEYADGCLLESLHSFLAKQQLCPGKCMHHERAPILRRRIRGIFFRCGHGR